MSDCFLDLITMVFFALAGGLFIMSIVREELEEKCVCEEDSNA